MQQMVHEASFGYLTRPKLSHKVIPPFFVYQNKSEVELVAKIYPRQDGAAQKSRSIPSTIPF